MKKPKPTKEKPPEAIKVENEQAVRDKISAREAELRNLNEDFNAKARQFQQFQQQCQVRANFLEGMIAELKELLPKPKEEKK